MFCLLRSSVHLKYFVHLALSPPQECSIFILHVPRPSVHLKWTCSVKQRWGRLGELTICVLTEGRHIGRTEVFVDTWNSTSHCLVAQDTGLTPEAREFSSSASLYMYCSIYWRWAEGLG